MVTKVVTIWGTKGRKEKKVGPYVGIMTLPHHPHPHAPHLLPLVPLPHVPHSLPLAPLPHVPHPLPVKTLQGLGMLDVSMMTVNARVQWFGGSEVQRRA